MIDYQGRIQLSSTILPLLQLCLLCIYPSSKNISKALNEKLTHSAVLPVRRDITMGDKIEQGSLSMGAKLPAVLQAWWGNAEWNAWFLANSNICNVLKTVRSECTLEYSVSQDGCVTLSWDLEMQMSSTTVIKKNKIPNNTQERSTLKENSTATKTRGKKERKKERI